nr:MAG TPA: hypothetical protein [Caudoviricetes sp.]
MLNVIRKKPELPEGYILEKVISLDSDKYDIQIGLYLLKPEDNKKERKSIFTITKGFVVKKFVSQGELTRDTGISLTRINEALAEVNKESMDVFSAYLVDALMSLSEPDKSAGKITINEMSLNETPELGWEEYLPF